MNDKKCPICGEIILVPARKFCSMKCYRLAPVSDETRKKMSNAKKRKKY